MHERSLAQALLTQIGEYAAPFDAPKLATIRLSVGVFSGIEPDLFLMALEELLAESVYRGAQVEMNVVSLEAECPDCGRQFAVVSFSFTCPGCGCQRTRILRGEELVLESLVLKGAASCPTST
ncbi:hydrogenase maturation nickel metallochaperone HypA [Blastopirellula marina]|uniref:Hydrogenase maturation factor HypA n=1 Tax=Blastopirellula marina TaxID=124 RepID=A0A2S8GHM2_9BACT|nr:hydrogenase maturation nickel metallochaperone HypA [Blastopirellula marina]PQO43945.1 hypothetical protein C5Y93_22445 [Blastopirellula marina]